MTHAPFGPRDVFAALSVIVLWGLNFVAMKHALHDFTPFQLGAARYVAAFLPLALFVKPPRIGLRLACLYGAFQLGQFAFLFSALQVGMTAALASVLMQTHVFFTALLAFGLLHEKPGRTLQVGLGLAALAIACFTMNFVAAEHATALAVTGFGFVLNLMAASMWAGGNIVVRKLQATGQPYEAVALVVWTSLVPIVGFALLSAVFDPAATRWRWLDAGWGTWASVAYLGWLATVVGYALWTGLLKRHPANRVAPFSLGVPVVGLSAGVFILGESITGWQWAGIALVVAALVCVMFGERIVSRLRRVQ